MSQEQWIQEVEKDFDNLWKGMVDPPHIYPHHRRIISVFLTTQIEAARRDEHDKWWYAAQYSIENKEDLDRLERAYKALTNHN